MLSARSDAIARLLSQMDEGDDDMLKKHSPKFMAMAVKAPADDAGGSAGDELSPEMIAKLMEMLKGKEGMAPMAPGETMSDDMKAEDMAPEKMAEGGMVEEDPSTADAQMARREDTRKAEQDQDAMHDMNEMANGAPSPVKWNVKTEPRKSRYYKR